MRVLSSPEALAVSAPRVVFCAGSFDGVHRGHRALLAAARDLAHSRGAEVWALTFEPHPLTVLAPEAAPPLLSPGDLRLEALADAGADGCLLLPFTKELAALSPADFCARAFGPWSGAETGRAAAIVAGPNWRFGRSRAGAIGDVPALTGGRVGARLVPLLEEGGAPISSTRIRQAVRAGRLEEAAALLGRPFRTRDRALAGRSRGIGTQLGAPTANLLPEGGATPPDGVYAVDVIPEGTDGAPLRAVANYGFRPTFPDARPDRPVLEVHVLDFAGDLYGRRLDVLWLRRLRDERRFPSPDALAAQIRLDATAARSL